MSRQRFASARRLLRPALWLAVGGLALLALSGLALRWQLGSVLALEDGRLRSVERLLPGAVVRATSTRWGIRGLEPYVRVDGFDMRTREGMRVRAGIAAVELDTLESLLRFTPVLGRLHVARAQVTLYQRADGSWSLPRSTAATATPWTAQDTERVADLLWESDRIAIDGFTAVLHPWRQPMLRLALDAQLSNERGDHRGRVRLGCGGTCAGSLDYALDGNPLLGVRNGGLDLALRGLPRVQGLVRVGDAWLDLLENRVRVQVGVLRGESVVRGGVQLGVRLRGPAGQLALRGRSSIVGGGPDGFDLRFPDLRLALNEAVLPLGGTVVGRRDHGWHARLPDFRLERLLAPIARSTVLPELASRWIAQLNPRVGVRDLRLRFGERFVYATELDGLTIEPYKGSPEIRGANASLRGHALGGRLVLLPGRFTLGFPDLYTQSFANVALTGPLDFWYDDGLRLHSGLLQGDSGDVKLAGRFALDRPDEPSMQAFSLLLEAQDGRTGALKRYLPYILDAPLKRWLDTAIGDGNLRHALVALHSYGNPQPGRRSQVEVAVDVDDMALRFQPEWPAITALDARIVVSNQHVFGDIRSARASAGSTAAAAGGLVAGTDGIEIGAGKVHVAPGDRHVALELGAHTSAAGLIGYLRASPVGVRLPWLAEWEGGGEFDLTMRGRISLDDDAHEFVVDSTHAGTQLANARLSVRLAGLVGPLRYSYPALVASPALTGTLNGERVRMGIASTDTEVRFDARGVGNGAWLEHWLPWPVAKGSTGSFAWASDMRIATANSPTLRAGETVIALETDLVGFGLLLPAPLTKLAALRRPVRFRLRSNDEVVQLAYDDPGLGFRGEMRDGRLARGVIGLGRPPDALPAAGLRIAGAPRELDVLAWGALVAAGGSGLELGIRADLESARVLLGDLDLPDGRMTVRRIADRYRVEFDQRDFEGALDIYAEQRPMHLALTRAVLPRAPEPAGGARSFVTAQGEAAAPDPLLDWRIKDFPSMSVDVKQLVYGDEVLGDVRFDLQPVADGIELRGVTGTLRGLAFNDARLTWRRDGRGDVTRFFGVLQARDVAPVLGSFGYAGSVASEKLTLRADLGWAGSPLAFSLRELDGSAYVDLRDGRFVQVESAGAARLLGIFDFASIARRARLDFTDVFGEGLSFDKIEGRMQFASGTLTFPDNLRVEGPGSEFKLAGRVDLATGALSNDMIVTLPLSRTLPWYAAYAALTANPLAGAGLLVAERLLRDQLNQFSSAKYHVSGTIDEPLVSFVSVFDRNLDQPSREAPGKSLSQEPVPPPSPAPARPGLRAPTGARLAPAVPDSAALPAAAFPAAGMDAAGPDAPRIAAEFALRSTNVGTAADRTACTEDAPCE